ncbi:MAG: hypothetical protein M0Q38_03920 [Bacteroidales bacterium]|jgi:hypothetical protein|nr:hypothetical protein [Bacteroidales bacterium]
MKKQTKIIIGAVLVLAVVIIAISFLYPTVFKGLTSGTIGKADKYHKTQMTEKDVMLRSELVADTGQLRNMIQGLIYFSLFTEEISNKIDSCVVAYKTQGICTDPNRCATISALQDFSDYIKNNNKTLRSTISLLTGFYLKDESDQSADVEKNLRDFGTYVNNLNEKDSVLNHALRSMDNYLLSNRILKTKKTELASLKSIRDQLLLQGVQLSGMLQNKPMCAILLSYALSSQQSLNLLMGQENLGVGLMPGAQQKLNIIANQDKFVGAVRSRDVDFGSSAQLGKIISAQQLGRVVNSKAPDLGMLFGSMMVYDKANLQFIVGNKTELQKVISASEISALLLGSQQLGNMVGVVVFSSQGLNLYQSNVSLSSGFLAQQNNLGLLYSSDQLNQVLSNQQGLGGVVLCSDFINLVGQLGNMGLGIIPSSVE